jgi:hypothetical protein
VHGNCLNFGIHFGSGLANGTGNLQPVLQCIQFPPVFLVSRCSKYAFNFMKAFRALKFVAVLSHLSIYLWLCGPFFFFYEIGFLFSFLILYAVGKTPWRGDQTVAKPLRTYRTTRAQNKRTQRHPFLDPVKTESESESESESYVTTDGQSASLSWNKAPIWGLRPDIY